MIFTFLSTFTVGSTVIITNINAGVFSIAQNAGQTIHLGNTSTTTGIGGILSSTAVRDLLVLTCSVADTDFWETYGSIGGEVTLA